MKLPLLLLLVGAICVPLSAQDGVKKLRQELAEIQEVRATLDQREKDIRKVLQQLEASTDKTKGVSSVCPVHKVKMRIETVPIAYGMMAIVPSDPPSRVR